MRTMEVAALSSPWPLSTKLKFGLALWLANFAVLFVSAQYGLYAYRGLVRTLSARSAELPLANSVLQHVSDLRVVLCNADEHVELSPGPLKLTPSRPLDRLDAGASLDADVVSDDSQLDDPAMNYEWKLQWLREDYLEKLNLVTDAVAAYHAQLEANQLESDARLGDSSYEWAKLDKINDVLESMSLESVDREHGRDWILNRTQAVDLLRKEADVLLDLAAELPSQLHERLQALAIDVRARYRTAIVLAWTSAVVAFGLLAVSIRLFYAWFARPLSRLVEASRQVASGNFAHRIQVDSADELGELAQASRVGLVGRLRLGVIPTIAPYLLPRIIGNLVEMNDRGFGDFACRHNGIGRIRLLWSNCLFRGDRWSGFIGSRRLR